MNPLYIVCMFAALGWLFAAVGWIFWWAAMDEVAKNLEGWREEREERAAAVRKCNEAWVRRIEWLRQQGIAKIFEEVKK